MKITDTTDSKKIEFYNYLFSELNKVPFGTYTKKDLECMILNGLIESDIVKKDKSRDLANVLEINENKLRNLLIEVRYKYQPDIKNNNIEAIIKDILANKQTKVIHDNGYYIFTLEDPIKKMDFEQGMKDCGYFSDSSFNKEVVKVKDYALVAFLFKFNNNDNTFNDLQNMKKAATENEKELLSKIDLQKSWLDIGKDLLAITSNAYDKIALLRKIALFIATGQFL